MGFKRILAAGAILFEQISPSSYDEKGEGGVISKYMHKASEGACLLDQVFSSDQGPISPKSI